MKIKVKIGNVRLNPKGHYKKNIIIENERGELLCVTPDLFVISFNDKNKLGNTSIINTYNKFTEEL